MGNCGGKEPVKHQRVSAEQQAKINEATVLASNSIENDVKKAEEEVKKAENEEEKEEKKEDEEEKEVEKEEEKEPSETPSQAREKRRQAEAKLKKAQKRLNKLESLRHAKAVGALTLDSFNTAVRRLQSATGNDPTNPDQQHTLPEGMEWFTTMLSVMWPGFRNYAKQSVLDTVQPALNRACAPYNVTCNITHFDLGANSPAFGPITARYVTGTDSSKSKSGLEISLGITIRSDMKLEMKTSVGSVGVQNFSFTGTLYTWFRPFLDTPPFIGALEFAFVNPPVLELDWTGFVGSALESFGLQKKVRDTINHYLSEYCVVPNFYVYPMVANHPKIDIARLRCPKPEGVVRLTVTGVKNAPSLPIGGDLTVNIKIGAQEWATPPAANPKIPRWSKDTATYDFIVYNKDQWVVLELCDGKGDDSVVGTVLNVPVNRLVKRGRISVPITKQHFPVTNSMSEPTSIAVQAAWVSIDPGNTAENECLASIQVSEVNGIPEGLQKHAPFRVQGSAGSACRATKPGVAKPGAITDPMEILKLLRSHGGKTPLTIAKIHGLTLPGDLDLVKQALAHENGKHTMMKTEEGTEWWMSLHYLLDWQAFPEDKTAKWASPSKKEEETISNKDYKRRVAYFESYNILYTWCNKIIATQKLKLSGMRPYYCQVLHLRCEEAAEVELDLISSKTGKKVAGTTIKIADTAVGDEPDAYGPWSLTFTEEIKEAVPEATVCQVSGDVTVRNLKVTDKLPANWNLEADALVAKEEFTEWWMSEQYVMDWAEWKSSIEADDHPASKYLIVGFKGQMWMAADWPGGDKSQAHEEELKRRDEFYTSGKDIVEGSGVNDDKEEALLQCLQAGALTWGDYDTVLAQLRGEPDPPALAETLEWLNMIVSACWPGVMKYTSKMIKETVEPQLQKTAEGYVPGLTVKFNKINLGRKEPAFGTIQCRRQEDGCELAFNGFAFESTIDIQMEITFGKTISIGIQDLLFKGDFLVAMKPLLPGLPLFGAMQIVMPNPPDIDLKLTGNAGGMLQSLKAQIPAIDSMTKAALRQSVAGFCAIPNYYVHPMVSGLDIAELRHPKPIGVLRIDAKEALHLRAGDTDNSDSYVIIKVGDTVKQTKPVTSLNPTWTAEEDSVMDFVVYNLDQIVDIEVFDADIIGSDDTLGALYQKTTVLGGGIDEIRRGIPVRSLRNLGTVALPLQEQLKDEVCTKPNGPTVYELRNVVGHDQIESVVVLQASWMAEREADDDSGVNSNFIASVCIHEAMGLNAGLKPPYTIKVTAGGSSATSNAGTAPPDNSASPSELAKTVLSLKTSGQTLEKIAKALNITLKLVQATSELAPDSLKKADLEALKKWHAECVTARSLHRRGTVPQFNQAMHVPFSATRETDLKGNGYVCPVTIELLNSSKKVIGTAVQDVSIGNPVNKSIQLEVETAPGAAVRCGITLTAYKGKTFSQKDLTEEEDVLGLTVYEGPEFVDTPSGVQPKIGAYVCARNLVKAVELNWKVTNKKQGQLVKRGDRPKPEGKIIGWTQDNARAVVDFGSHWGEWRVKPENLCNAPLPLPPPPPPEKLYIVSDEVMEVEGEFDVMHIKKCRGMHYWEREAYGEGEIWRIFTDEAGRWAVGPAHMEGVAYIRTVQPHHGRFPHMMGHSIDPVYTALTEEEIAELTSPRILWQRMDIDLDAGEETVWVDDATIEITITKPIAREHEEVLDEMHDQIIEDIMEDLEADLLEDIEADLQADLEADLQADLENDLEAEMADEIEIEEYDEAAAAAEEAEAEEAARLAEEEEERQRQEEEEAEAARLAEEEERRRQEEEERQREEEERRREEEERKRDEEEERQRQEEAEKQRKTEEAAASRKNEEEQERKRKEEEEQKQKAEEAKKRSEEERLKKEAEEKKRKAEEEKKRKEEEKKKKEEEERKRKEAEKKKKEEEERKKKEEAERKKREEAERKRKEEEERRRKEELRKKKAEAERKKREQERKAKKAAKRKGKMETLQKALELGAINKMDHVTALRRLQAVTGDDPTNPGRAYTLPETMQWFTTTVEVIWPHLRTLLSDKLREICAPALEEVSSNIEITKMDLGNHSPAFGPISAKFLEKESIEIGLGLTYTASVDIRFKVGDEEAVVQRLKFVGTMYFWLRPFLNRVPFIGGMQAAFANAPTVKFMFTTAKSLAYRRAQQVIQRAVEKTLSENCVVPNFITVPFGESQELQTAFASPIPQGVLRLTIVRGNDLEAADEGFNPTSDPYVTVSVGAQKWQTETKSETLSPVWESGNTHNFMVYSPEQWVCLDVYDEDEGKTDDHLGGVVGLPVNRLILRCMDKDNKAGTVDLPLQRNNQPVQGEEGDVSTITVKAEWLTVDQNQASVGESLIAVTLKDLEGLPTNYEGPFRIRVQTDKNTIKTSKPSTPLQQGQSARSLFKMIAHLSKDGKTASYISDTVSVPVTLVQAAITIINNNCGQSMATIATTIDDESLAEWVDTAQAFLTKRDASGHPYFLDTVYLHTQSLGSKLKLELLDSSNEVMGSSEITLADDKLGDEPDAEGPFEIPLPASRGTVLLNGHATVSSLVAKGVPASWNPRSKRHKAMGDKRKQKGNEDLIKQNAGGKLTNEKEEALSECLKAGSLTWGDYDILIGKLRGESDRTSIAETLEWVNMIIIRIWPMFRTFLEGKIRTDVNDQLKISAASLPGQSWTGLGVDVKKVDLGAKEPSFTSIEAWKKEKDNKTGVAISFNNITYDSNIDLELEVTVGGYASQVRVKDLKLKATLCVELHDLTSELPFIGSIEAYFPNPPHVDVSLDVAGNKEIPGMRSLSVGAVNAILAREVVLPNSLYWNAQGTKKTVREPEGVLKLSILRAKHLLAGDMAVRYLKDANSDAYTYVRLGSQIFSTAQITSLNPEWLETFNLLVHDKRQWVDLEVFDADIKSDDSLGAILQKETILGGGTELISRGIPVEALCRKIWNADDRNKDHVALALMLCEKDTDLSVDTDPYKGARVLYKGGGKHNGSVQFEDGSVLDEGDEGVVVEIDNTTKPFSTFTCEFPKCVAGLHAGDLTVTRPLIVNKMTEIVGDDGNPSLLHVFPEWLSTKNKGQHTSHLITITPTHIENAPSLDEQDLGGPFKLQFTAEEPSVATEKCGVVTTPAAHPETPCDTPLADFISAIVKMDEKGSNHKDIAASLQLSEELVKEGLELFAVPSLDGKPSGVETKLVILPKEGKKGKKLGGWALVKGELEKDARKRLRKALNVPMGCRLVLKNESGEQISLNYESISSQVGKLTYSMEMSPTAYSWQARARAHVDKLRTASAPHFSQPVNLVTATPTLPTLRLELLSSSNGVLGTTKIMPPYNEEVYSVQVKQEASGGWGFGMGAKEGYSFDLAVFMRLETCKLNMMN